MPEPNAARLRGLREEDVAACCAIAVRAWTPIHEMLRKDYGDGLYRAALGGWQGRKAAEVEDFCRRYPGNVVVTELGGEVVGFATFHVRAGGVIGVLGNNAVDPRHQGKGIGVRQIAHAVDELTRRGVHYVEVITGLDQGHAPALAMYEKLGFVQRRRTTLLYKDVGGGATRTPRR